MKKNRKRKKEKEKQEKEKKEKMEKEKKREKHRKKRKKEKENIKKAARKCVLAQSQIYMTGYKLPAPRSFTGMTLQILTSHLKKKTYQIIYRAN